MVRSATWQPPAGVRVLRGDLTSEGFLREAVRGQDAVLSALGLRLKGLAPWNKPERPDFLVASTSALLAAMKAEGVKRLLAISAGGVGDSREKVPGAFRAMIALTALKRAYAELEKMEIGAARLGPRRLPLPPLGPDRRSGHRQREGGRRATPAAPPSAAPTWPRGCSTSSRRRSSPTARR